MCDAHIHPLQGNGGNRYSMEFSCANVDPQTATVFVDGEDVGIEDLDYFTWYVLLM